MIKSSIFNAINFTSDINRKSKFFDPSLQRVKNILSSPLTYETGDYSYLSFEYMPDEMPETAPTGKLYILDDDGETFGNQERIVELSDRFIYFFMLTHDTNVKESAKRYYVEIGGEYVYSEWVDFYKLENLAKNCIVQVRSWNNDETKGYIPDNYPACGFFKYSDFHCDIFGNEKVEYGYSFGRKKILSSENYIKTRLTFINLSMYQQNLLKTLCNCQNLKINGVLYYLISDFTEKNKDENNEICDLQAEFVEVDQSYFRGAAAETPSEIRIKNLFTR